MKGECLCGSRSGNPTSSNAIESGFSKSDTYGFRFRSTQPMGYEQEVIIILKKNRELVESLIHIEFSVIRFSGVGLRHKGDSLAVMKGGSHHAVSRLKPYVQQWIRSGFLV